MAPSARLLACFPDGINFTRLPMDAGNEIPTSATERGGNNLTGFKDFHLENGSSQGQNLALSAVCVPGSLDSEKG